MASIDFLWKQYLSSEGYSSLRDALLDQTGLTNGQIDFLWYKYLEGEGYSGSLPAMMYNWLRDKGYSGSLPYMMYRALEDGNVFGGDTPPIGCSITLTGDIGPSAGFAAADVNGQAFSVTDAAVGVYMASTDFVNRRPMPAPGKKVWIQCDGFSGTDGVGVWSGFYLFDALGAPIGIVRVLAARWSVGEGPLVYGVGTLSIYDVNDPGNSPEPIVFVGSEPVLPQYLSIAVDSEGEVFFYDQQAGEVVAASSIEPEWAGFFENAESMCLIGTVESYSSGSITGTGHFTTAADDMLDVDYLGGEDWCGNELPAPPAPDPSPDPLPEFTFTLSMFENGSIVNNPGAPPGWDGAWWHNDYVPPSVITVDEPAPAMSTSELAAWVESVIEDADAQDEIPDGTEIGTNTRWWKWESKPGFFVFKMGGGGFVYCETLAEALVELSAGDVFIVCARTTNNTGGSEGEALGPGPVMFGLSSGEFEVSYYAPTAQFSVGEA